MEARADILDQCKDTIARRAASMALRFEKSDIMTAGCGDGNECVFLKCYFDTPRVDENYNFVLDENGDVIVDKLPNVWMEFPSRELIKHRSWKDGESFMAEFSMPPPRVYIRIPALVMLVAASGKVKDGAVIGGEIAFDLTG